MQNVQEIPDGRPYRRSPVEGKKLPGYLVRSTGLLSHLGSIREEWAVLAIAARLSDVTESSDTEAIQYRNRHTGNEHTVGRDEGTIIKSRQSIVEDLRRRIWKKAKRPSDWDLREQWTDDFESDYDRIRHATDRLAEGEYLVNEGPAVEADSKLIQDRNGRRWAVDGSFRDMPDADPQRRFVRCTGPDPQIDRDALHIDVLDALERLVAHREDLHEDFTAGFKAEQKDGKWQKHQPKSDAARSHQWTAKNGTDRPQYISVGRWRPEEIEEESLKGERAVFVPWVIYDIDADTRERCGELGRELVQLLSDHLTEEQLEQVLVSYTGGTSIHVRVPAGLLGNPVFKDAESAARTLSEFTDELCGEESALRRAIDDRLFHPQQQARMIGSMYEEDTAPPDNASHRPKLIQRLSVRPQISDREHAADVADQILEFLRRRHLDISDVSLDFSGTRPVTITDAPDRTPQANRVTATTAPRFLQHGPEPLWARSECGTHQPLDLPDPTEANHAPTLAALLHPHPHTHNHTPHEESATHSVAKQPPTGEYERALQVTREGEKWGRDVDKPHLVGRNRAALTVSMHRLTYSETPWRDVCAWNRQMAEPLPEGELRKTFRSAKSYV